MATRTEKDAQIVAWLKSGATNEQQLAYAGISKWHKKGLRNLALQCLKNHPELDPDFILDEAIEKAMGRIDAFTTQTGGGFSAWLRSIVRNYCIDEIRKHQSRQRKAERARHGANATEKAKQDFLQLDEKKIEAILMNLKNPHQKQALYHQFVHKMKYQEIADKMQLPINTVRSHIRRGKQRLKKVLSEKNNGR